MAEKNRLFQKALDRVLAPIDETNATPAMSGSKLKDILSLLGKKIALGAVEPVESYGRALQALQRGDTKMAQQEAFNTALGVGLAGRGASATLAPEAEGNTLGMFVGIHAGNANHEALKKALQLESLGASRGDIFNQTGWFRGADKRWRFEIPDQGNTHFQEGSPLSFLPYDLGANRPLGEEAYAGKLGDFMVAPKLLEAYPEIADITLATETPWVRNSLGYWDSNNEQIVLNPHLSNDEVRHTLLHEIQHTIQDAEGWSPGSSPSYVMSQITPMLKADFDNARVRLTKLQMRGPTGKRIGSLDEILQAKDDLQNATYNMYHWLSNPSDPAKRFQAYKRVAGEQEAEKTARRGNETQLEYPFSTGKEDEPYTRQFVLPRQQDAGPVLNNMEEFEDWLENEKFLSGLQEGLFK